jgi:hypothetical protein
MIFPDDLKISAVELDNREVLQLRTGDDLLPGACGPIMRTFSGSGWKRSRRGE